MTQFILYFAVEENDVNAGAVDVTIDAVLPPYYWTIVARLEIFLWLVSEESRSRRQELRFAPPALTPGYLDRSTLRPIR